MKKRILALLGAALLALLPLTALAEAAETVTVPFEDGFALDLPADWLFYPVPEADAAAGLVYLLSDAEGAHFLCISRAETEAETLEDLAGALRGYEGVTAPDGDSPFVTYTAGDGAGAAALLDGAAWSFLFPAAKDDPDFQALAGEILASFALTPAEEAE